MSYNVEITNAEDTNGDENPTPTDTTGLGEITNTSGDNTGKIDLTPIINAIDNQTQIIFSGDKAIIISIDNGSNKIAEAITSGDKAIIKAIESGEQKAQERDNFWRNIYNSLFIIESGEIEKKVEKFKNEIKITSGEELESMSLVLNQFTKEPSDFIIEWENIEWRNKIIIPSGDINFSAKVREIPALKKIHTYIQLIMGYTILIVFSANLWDTTLAILGVSRSIYEDHEEEKERLETITNYDVDVVTGRTRENVIYRPNKHTNIRYNYGWRKK